MDFTTLCLIVIIMAIRVVDFSNGVYKIRKIFAKEKHAQRKFLNFENLTNGEPKYVACKN